MRGGASHSETQGSSRPSHVHGRVPRWTFSHFLHRGISAFTTPTEKRTFWGLKVRPV